MKKNKYYIIFKNGNTTTIYACTFQEAFIKAMYKQLQCVDGLCSDILTMEDQDGVKMHNPRVTATQATF